MKKIMTVFIVLIPFLVPVLSSASNDVIFISDISELKRHAPKGVHATNGTYVFTEKLVVPPAIAGFHHVITNEKEKGIPLFVAVNSDLSMKGIIARRGGSPTKIEEQKIRALKVAQPLSDAFDRKVLVAFYDEETPRNLYAAMQERGLNKTLHKWGYGVKADGPGVEGSDLFEEVFAFPLPGDSKPLCYSLTSTYQHPPHNVRVVDLRELWINSDNLLRRIPLPTSLSKKYTARRYNVVLMDKQTPRQFEQASQTLTEALGDEGLKYHLRPDSLPHVSVFQMELSGQVNIHELAAAVQKIWGKRPKFMDTRVEFDTRINSKYDSSGEYQNTTWFELLPKKKELLFDWFHREVASLLNGRGIHCLNASHQDYRPHLTLASYQGRRSAELECANDMTADLGPAIVEANWEWEAVREVPGAGLGEAR